MKGNKIWVLVVFALAALLALTACEAAEGDADLGDAGGDVVGEVTAEVTVEGAGEVDSSLDPDGDGQVTICHATGSKSNPYEEISIDVSGVSGHDNHEGDIIPAPEGGCASLAGTAEPTAEATATAEATDEAVCEAGTTIADMLVEFEDEDTDDLDERFEEFGALVAQLPDVQEMLDSDGEYTVFAPIDLSFEDVNADDLDGLLDDEDELRELVLGHIVEGEYTTDELADMDSVTAMNGETITIAVEQDDDGNDVIVLNGTAQVVEPDVDACNGVIHGIDQVLGFEGASGVDNDNGNLNANTNDNANVNTNENANTNDNANVNENENVNENDNTGVTPTLEPTATP